MSILRSAPTVEAGSEEAIGQLIEAVAGSAVSIVIPTYREAENIPLIIQRIDAVRRRFGLKVETLFLDDDSRDGSVEAVAAAGFDWAKIIVRGGPRGLSPAVVDGFRVARYPILVCMDCDLSHPPERIPQMLLALASGQQMAIGSRYVPGGSTDDDWGLLRWLNSLIATMLARPLTTARDPMSGFFALRRRDFDAADNLNPVGYKIALELIVKCGFENIAEIPIHFSDRQFGESKLSLREQLKYIQHLRRLYIHKFENAMYLVQFLTVGMSGAFVNMVALSALLASGATEAVALAGGIGVSLATNFMLNRRFTFSHARSGNVVRQFFGFLGASAVGLFVNYTVALYIATKALSDAAYGPHLGALAGIAAGMTFNFLGNRYIVFRKRYIRK